MGAGVNIGTIRYTALHGDDTGNIVGIHSTSSTSKVKGLAGSVCVGWTRGKVRVQGDGLYTLKVFWVNKFGAQGRTYSQSDLNVELLIRATIGKIIP